MYLIPKIHLTFASDVHDTHLLLTLIFRIGSAVSVKLKYYCTNLGFHFEQDPLLIPPHLPHH